MSRTGWEILALCSVFGLAGCGPDGSRSLVSSLRQALSPARPDLTSERTPSPFSGNGHTLSYDGRLTITNVEITPAGSTRWLARVFRPEALSYGADGRPQLGAAFSTGRWQFVNNGENSLAFCASSATQIGRIEGGSAIYDPYIIESRMGDIPTPPPGPPETMEIGHFRRRTMRVRVANPLTPSAEAVEFTTGPLEYLRTTAGQTLRGIETTITGDGRLLVFQGAPANDGNIDHLMYSYNPAPCAVSGWSVPLPLHRMNTDPGVQEYPVAWQPLRAATGELFSTAAPIRAAYPWIDPEGRNVLYLATLAHDGRREAATLIGADVDHTAYAIDGGINQDQSFAKLFYSSPLWEFERDQPGGPFDSHYLPVTDAHDVLPFFGSNSADYNEVDLGNVEHPFDFVYADMYPLVTLGGALDFTHTKDSSGAAHVVALEGDAALVPSQPPSSGLHARGHVASLSGAGGLRISAGPLPPPLPAVSRGFSLQLAVNPDPSLATACPGSLNPWRYLADAPGSFNLISEVNGSVQLSLIVDGQEVRLGFSPPLTRGVWSHVAYSWDGVSGRFREYINGLDTGRPLPRVAGSIVRPTDIALGSMLPRLNQTCADQGGLSFIGKLDEFRLFWHARTQRSVCQAALGADCALQAIQSAPSTGQSLLSYLNPDCSTPDQLNSLSCRSALHRFCAQRGAKDAIGSASNVLDTALQLISARPPVALAGVPTQATARNVTVACTPLLHQTFPIEYHELAERHDGCKNETMIPTTACEAAAHRTCAELGFTSGHLFDGTARAWLNCFNAAQISAVPAITLGPSCGSGAWESAACRLEVSNFCGQSGHAGGVVQELMFGTTAEVHCFDPASLVQASFSVPFERWANRLGGFLVDQYSRSGDFNNDGRADLARIFNDAGSISIDVYLSNGKAFQLTRFITRQGAYAAGQRWLAGDFNRDGRTDLAKVFNDAGSASIDVYQSTGTSFTRRRWVTRQGAFTSAQFWMSGDFNGDRRTDLAKAFDDQGSVSIDVHRSNGSSFILARWATRLGGYSSTQRWLSGDLDGDGRADIAKVFDDLAQLSVDSYRSAGSSFSLIRWATRLKPFVAGASFRADDFDGDEIVDLAELTNDAGFMTIHVLRTLSGAPVSERWGSKVEVNDPSHVWLNGDYTGDGKAELVRLFSDQAMLSADVWIP